MNTIGQLLESKGGDVFRIAPEDSVFDAIKTMAEHEVGSVLVMDGDRLVGMFTERHYAREVFLKGKRSPDTRIRDVMTTEVLYVTPQQTINECMAVMTDKRIRHLPVLDAGKVVGIVSIGDLVKSKIADQEFTIDQLVHYIHG